MANYAIGDIQGCWQQLKNLLHTIKFKPTQDRLWCVGDLVNRGPQSLEVLQFLMDLDPKPIITLGNHDIYLLKRLANSHVTLDPRDSLKDILNYHDARQILDWLREQHIFYFDSDLNIIMTHAGMPPFWNLYEAKYYASKFEQALQDDNYKIMLDALYGNEPALWANNLTGYDAMRFTVNAFTRMRYLKEDGAMDFSCTLAPEVAPEHLIPWFNYPRRSIITQDIIFGHWASLHNIMPKTNCYALDTGCVWGGKLTALRLEDKKIFQE